MPSAKIISSVAQTPDGFYVYGGAQGDDFLYNGLYFFDLSLEKFIRVDQGYPLGITVNVGMECWFWLRVLRSKLSRVEVSAPDVV